jgi:hypothetical protein
MNVKNFISNISSTLATSNDRLSFVSATSDLIYRINYVYL